MVACGLWLVACGYDTDELRAYRASYQRPEGHRQGSIEPAVRFIDAIRRYPV